MPGEETGTRRGGCLCGAVRYEVIGPLRGVVACHCSQCRRTSGHFVAATAAKRGDLRIADGESLSWYRSSAKARRGFCSRCGSSLFWDADGRSTVSIMAGSLDPPTGLETLRNIHVEDASDYYSVPADAPQGER
jgi:hypothetical protein